MGNRLEQVHVSEGEQDGLQSRKPNVYIPQTFGRLPEPGGQPVGFVAGRLGFGELHPAYPE